MAVHKIVELISPAGRVMVREHEVEAKLLKPGWRRVDELPNDRVIDVVDEEEEE